MTYLSIHLLGPFHVTLNEEPVTEFESNKVRALLAYLAVEASRPHSRDELTGLLWPNQPDRTARRNLSQALFNLRCAIRDDAAHPPFLHITRRAIQFNQDSDHRLDVADFVACIATSGVQQLEKADRLYRGEFLTGFFVDDSISFGEWATLRRERFHRQALDAQYHLTEYYERGRDYERARHYARRQVELEPWREEAHQQLMRLLARSGQRSAALQQYETCCRILAEELGIEPTETTQRLYQRLRSIPSIGAHNLPTQATPFVGRESELRETGRRLLDPGCRLLTLAGTGGVGKTRLAIQAAYENHLAFLHGVCFVPLAALQSAEFLVPTIASALQLPLHSETDPKEQLLDALREREILLLLDNFEHLIEDGADLLIEIMKSAPEVKLLVTSRERLNLYGETLFDVEGLRVPAEVESAMDYDAVRLFLQCADRIRAGFTPANGGLAEVVHICHLVEGMPLGIELAASWVRELSCREIATEIEQSLAFLSASTRGIPPRHRSVQAAFDYSWKRLPLEERHVFQKLSVFRGGFEREAAARVVGASSTILSALLDKSFLNSTPTGRYDLHELMRQYGAEKLAQDPQEALATHNDHCCYYARFLRDQFAHFRAGHQQESLDAIGAEIDNLRAAWQWGVAQKRHDDIEGLMLGLYTFYYNRSRYREGYALLEKAIAALDDSTRTEERARCLLGKLLWRLGDLLREFDASDEKARTEALTRRSVALLRGCGDKAELAESLVVMGHVMDKQGRRAEAIPFLEESVAVARQLEDRSHLAWALDSLGEIIGGSGDLPRARQLLQESLAISRECNYLLGMAHNFNNLGAVAYWAGDYARAKEWFLEGKAAFEELGDPGRTAMTISNAGEMCVVLGEDEAAFQYLLEALRIAAARRLPRLPFNTLYALAALLNKQGQPVRAYELAIFVKRHPMTEWSVHEDLRPLLAELEAKLPPETAAAAKARAKMWNLDDAVAKVLDEAEGCDK